MILAIELSSCRGGIALLDGDSIRGARMWLDASARHTAFWPAMQELVRETRPDWNAVSLYAVGRGPGSYSGLRAALTAAAMLAAPGGQPVHAISSGAILAAGWFDAPTARGDRVVVAGDARRGAVWYSIFERGEHMPRQIADWALCTASEFPERIPAGTPVLTSERDRMDKLLGGEISFDLQAMFPSAETLARLAHARAAAGVPSEPADPLYLHPPV